MNIFTIYNLETGEIEYSTTTTAEIDEIGLSDGQGIIEGSFQPNEYKVIDGEAVIRNDNALEILRLKRDALLKESDWTLMPDSPLSDAKKIEWATYRQSLRDLPSNNSDITSIDDVIFPSEPN